MAPLKHYFLSFVGHRRLPAILVVAAILLVLPSLWSGLQLDDFYHWFYLTGKTGADGRTLGANDLFNFLDGTGSRVETLMDAGVLPWWTSENLRLAFWRPLSGLTHRLDYLLWPDQPWLMHLQSFAWFALVIVVATLLFRRLNAGLIAAGLAALFFALDDAHGLPAGWLANRNALISTFFGLGALLSHVRWRTDGWKAGMILGPVTWAVGLLSAEIAMGAGAFLFAWALCLDPGSRRTRAVSLLPYAVVFIAWIVYHSAAGYGTAGSGFYVDPVHEPLRFIAAIAEKAPVLLLDQFGFPPSSIAIFLHEGVKSAIWWWAVVFLALLGFAFGPMIARERTARFWVLGTLLSVPLICTTIPNSRLLMFTGFGGMGLLGMWIGRYLAGVDGDTAGSSRKGLPRIFFAVMIAVHGILAPILLPLNSLGAAMSEKLVQEPITRMKLSEGIREKTLVLVNAPVFFYAQLIPTVLEYQGRPSPGAIRVLAPGEGKARVTRVSATALLIRCEDGWLHTPFDNVFRDVESPMKVGETIVIERMTVGIRETTPDGRPSEVLFRFSVPLEDSSLEWMKWENRSYVRFTPPTQNSTIVLSIPPVFF